MLALDSPPTAFLVASLISALGVRRAIEERGLVLGRDVSVVTHDDALGYFSDPDAVPVGDLVLRRALGVAKDRDVPAAMERWRPQRAYAVFHLWASTAW